MRRLYRCNGPESTPTTTPRTPRRLVATGAGAILILSTHLAFAQLDSSNVPLPNVMLLLDNSGSFEFMIDGSSPEAASNNPIIVNGSPTTLYAACSPTPVSPAPGNPYGSNSPAPGSVAGSVPNRWGTAVQALTGSISPFYSCVAMNRQAPIPNGFTNQYSLTIGGVHSNPYDYGYNLPFHRPLAYNPTTASFCAITPNALPGASGSDGVGMPAPSNVGGLATDFPSTALTQSYFNFATGQTWNGSGQAYNAAEACTFTQLNNGAIDSASSLMRFGLMTFDNDTDPGTGVNFGGASLLCANTTTSPFEGMWSYFPNWTTSNAGYLKGWPQGCATQPPFELGARNPGAPPWEGRMVGFPSPSADTATVAVNNNNVQAVINATRPFGGTPTAALLDDAEYYFWEDPSGPSTDPFVTSGNLTGGTGCRSQFIILLTDGVPNEDLRSGGTTCGCTPLASGQCVGHGAGGAACPYDLPQNTAGSLNQGNDTYTGYSGAKITTYVIGFAVSTVQNGAPVPAQCASLVSGTPGSLTLSSVCGTPATLTEYPQYAPCCLLQNVALTGSNYQTGAFFADTPGDLAAALGQVLGIIAKQVATQTLPSFAVTSSYAGAPGGSESMYVASFNAATAPWSGDVVREQLVCTASMGSYTVTEQVPPVQPANGDDFLQDINSTSASARRFLTYIPGAGTSGMPTTSGLTIRPFVGHTVDSGGDNLGTFGTTTGSEVGLAPTAIVPGAFPLTPSPGAFNLTNYSCQDPVSRAYLSASDCAGVALQFAMAQTSVSTPSDPNFATTIWPQTTRCGGTAGTCSPLGGILHSTPAVSAAPSALFRDDSYQGFTYDVAQFATAGGIRPPVLYTATTDGLLHAFDTSVTTKTNNELWSFIPPGVLPNLIREYYDASAVILDGAPVVQDVVWDRYSGTPAPASCPGTWDQCWHTMLVAGYGGGGRGYYALDVTDPRYVAFHASTPATFPPPPPPASTGPHFQWQLASTQLPPPGGPAQQELFGGQQSGTPALANVLVDLTYTGTATPHEVGVAILPGGLDGPPVAGTCKRTLNQNPGNYNPPGTYDISDPSFPRRTYVRQWATNCYGANSSVAGRSVTIVRVDTGEILAVFARSPSDSTPASPDVPTNLTTGAVTLASNRLIPAPFDSPMTGTPIVYPSELGSDAQRVYIGDADGTLWRIDLTNTNPAKWTAAIFADAYAPVVEGGVPVAQMATDSQPISVRPLVALDDFGDVTIEFATGDTGSYTTTYSPVGSTAANPIIDYVYATQENAAGTAAQVNWYLKLTNGERVSGPMVVFNDTLYFATFAPANPTVNACNGGVPRMWGLDFTKVAPSCPVGLTPNNVTCPTPLGDGGNPRDFLAQTPAGIYTSPPDQNGNSTAGTVIPGVTVTYTPACLGAAAETPAAPMLTALVGRAPTMGSPTPIGIGNLNGPTMAGGPPGTLLSNLPHTRVDSWASIVE